MSKDYLDKWEERAKKNTEIIEQQQAKTKMSESDIPCIECGCTIYWDNGECENCGMDN